MSQIQLYNTNAYEAIKSLPDKSIDLIITDPPYLLSGLNGRFAKEAGGGNYAKLIQMQDTLGKGFDFVLFNELERIQPKLNAYIFCNAKLLKSMLAHFASRDDINSDILIWHKTNARPQPRSRYKFDVEYILYLSKGAHLDTFASHFSSHIYTSGIRGVHNKMTTHPTEKPLTLIENLVLNSSREGETVLDCFMGGGTTARACKLHNRNFIGCEIDKDFYEQAKASLKSLQHRLAI